MSQDLTVYNQHLLLLMSAQLSFWLTLSVSYSYSPMTLPGAGWRVEFSPGTRLSELAVMGSPRTQEMGSISEPGRLYSYSQSCPRRDPGRPREDQMLSLSPEPTQPHTSRTPGLGAKDQGKQTGPGAWGSSLPLGVFSCTTSGKGEPAGGQWPGGGGTWHALIPSRY